MEWISTKQDSTRHATASLRERVLVGEQWKWRAKTACGRTITGHSGQSTLGPDCASCAKAVR